VAGPTKPEIAPGKAILLKIFLLAFIIRCAYALALYAGGGADDLMGTDSVVFVAQAQAFANALHAGTVGGSHWLGDASNTMPLYQWLTALPYYIFGHAGAIAYVTMQTAFDAGTCVLVFMLAGSLDPRLALPAAIIAAFNPTQIVLSGIIYTDTPYTFFVTLSLYLAHLWTRTPSLARAAAFGGALAAAVLVRVTVAPWAFGAIVLLGAYAALRHVPPRRSATIVVSAAILGLSLGVISLRSYGQYGTFALTPQGGEHFALWIVPLAKETQDRTPFTTSVEDIIRRTTERYGPRSANPFEQSRRFQQIGQEVLHDDIKITALAASWVSGIFINLASPALLLSPPISHLPRTGFYDTLGNSFSEKAFNYAFRSGNATYSWLLILGTAGLIAIRAMQLLGLVVLLAQRRFWPRIVFAGSWIVFLLLLNGPIASPKYRLPLEPLFNIMTAAGLLAMGNFRRRTPLSLLAPETPEPTEGALPLAIRSP
jgi:4-amino-4-deoxy-L-arabinose transferase-like glycosyltransferase